MQWWIALAGRDPIGPVTTDQIMRGIAAGKVPDEALVCEVGGQTWQPLRSVTQFDEGTRLRAEAAFRSAEATVLDLGSLPPESTPELESGVYAFDESAERTIVDADPIRPSDPPPISELSLLTPDAPLLLERRRS
jgi:hypothetical protein